MNATVIDTLRFANRLKAAGFEAPRAEGMARALGDELADRMLTRSDLDEALGPVQANIRIMEATVEAMDTKFDAKFEALDTKFDAKFEATPSSRRWTPSSRPSSTRWNLGSTRWTPSSTHWT